MDVTARSSKNSPALEQAIGRLRRCDDALLRHLARQIERDELSATTAMQMLERFEIATLGQLSNLGQLSKVSQLAKARTSGSAPTPAASDEMINALKRRIEILGDTLRHMDGATPTLELPRKRPGKVATKAGHRPRSSRSGL